MICRWFIEMATVVQPVPTREILPHGTTLADSEKTTHSFPLLFALPKLGSAWHGRDSRQATRRGGLRSGTSCQRAAAPIYNIQTVICSKDKLG